MIVIERRVHLETSLQPESEDGAPSSAEARAGVADVELSLGWASRAMSRSLDIVVASVALLLLSPLMLLLGLAVRLTSPGPAFFRQIRIGFGGEPFVMLKFRTMEHDNDDSIHRAFVTAMLSGEAVSPPLEGIYKLTEDPRVTSLGAHLRRLSLDELPQLINVVLGEMSLVGPRPALPWEVKLFEPEHLIRFQVKPGVTGLWQVSGRSNVSLSGALAMDSEYARRHSLGFDLAILLRTIPVLLWRRGAW
jgi:lipopolysaccharide/colanic/teichoic acid biosynthesis glycosyltransferase